MRFVPNRGFIPAFTRSPEMRSVLEDRAAAGERFAVSISPVRTGEYRSSFRIEVVGGQVRLVNTSDHAVYVETTNGDRVLGRATDVIERGT